MMMIRKARRKVALEYVPNKSHSPFVTKLLISPPDSSCNCRSSCRGHKGGHKRGQRVGVEKERDLRY